jgi:hypothetical protein
MEVGESSRVELIFNLSTRGKGVFSLKLLPLYTLGKSCCTQQTGTWEVSGAGLDASEKEKSVAVVRDHTMIPWLSSLQLSYCTNLAIPTALQVARN